MARLSPKISKGFTLIELMVTIAIVGILASISLPAYNRYIAKAQATEVYSIASALKIAIAEYYMTNGSSPWSLTQLGYPDTHGKYVNETWFLEDENRLVIQLAGNQAGVNSLIRWAEIYLDYTEDEETGSLVWTCSSNIEDDSIRNAVMPQSCKDYSE